MKTFTLTIWTALLLLICCTITMADATSNCPIYPTPRSYHSTGETIPLGTSQTTVIILPEKASVPQRYAGERLQELIRNRFKVELPIAEAEKLISQEVTLQFVLSVNPSAVTKDGKTQFNGFSIQFDTKAKPKQISIIGADDSGLIYGCEAMFNLIARDTSGTAQITVANVLDWPSIPWRGRPHSIMAQQLWSGQLETYIHGRINFVDYRDNPKQPATVMLDARKSSMGCPPGEPIDEPFARHAIDEFHRRGLYVYGVVSCNIKENEYDKLTQTFDKLRTLGCDGIWVSMDDTGGGQNPVKLAQFVAQYMKKIGLKGHDVLFTPSGREYTTMDRPLNHQMAKIETFNEATWIFTRVPCKADYEFAKKIGLKNKVAWWYNFCETSYPDPKAGFIHSPSLLTTQRKDGRPSYMTLQPITPGWGSPEFDKIRDAAQYVDHVNIWAICGGWSSEYSVVMFGLWAWNPESCNWSKMQTAIYDYVWGPSQVETIRQFDKTFEELKKLYRLPVNWSFRTPEGGLVHLKSVENRAKALELLDKLDALAEKLAQNAPNETAMSKERLEYLFIEPIKTSLKFARKQATLDYPDYEFQNFEKTAKEIASQHGLEEANKYLERVNKTVREQIRILRAELSELKDIDPILDAWEQRINKAKDYETFVHATAEDMLSQWNKFVTQPIDRFFPFMEQPSEGTLTGLFDNLKDQPTGKIISTRSIDDWSCKPIQHTGSYRVGKFTRNEITATAIMVPINTPTHQGDCGWIEQTLDLKSYPTSNGKLYGRVYMVDTRIDHVYEHVRRVDILVNGKVVHTHDISDKLSSNWIEFPLSTVSDTDSICRIVIRVTELKPVQNHTSWLFVEPLQVVEK